MEEAEIKLGEGEGEGEFWRAGAEGGRKGGREVRGGKGVAWERVSGCRKIGSVGSSCSVVIAIEKYASDNQNIIVSVVYFGVCASYKSILGYWAQAEASRTHMNSWKNPGRIWAGSTGRRQRSR